MILWLVFFVLVVAVSYVLAMKSMKDVSLSPGAQQYGLFLIRKKEGLNNKTFISIHDYLQKSGLNISFERLFKGKESALVVFGPRKLLAQLAGTLDLLELEDYSNVKKALCWEIGIKGDIDRLDIPKLNQEGHLWWQLILWVNSKKGGTLMFSSQIRAAVVGTTLPTLSQALVKLPKAYSNEQMLYLYKKRSFQKNNNLSLNPGQIQQLLWL